jgi:hypothetical protein
MRVDSEAGTPFAKISSINPANPESWLSKIFLSFDIDWAIDEAVESLADMLEARGVAATFFVTHDSPVLARLASNPLFELGIHPNFDPLLAGGGGNAAQVFRELLAIVPGARATRSHALTSSGRLTRLIHENGLTHECNQMIPLESGMVLRPYAHWNGLIRVPHLWEDDVHMQYVTRTGVPFSVDAALTSPGLKVFDFHPIHVALNSPDMAYYERTREQHRNWASLRACANEGRGTATLLQELIDGAVLMSAN